MQIAMKDATAPLNQNRGGSATPNGATTGWIAPDTVGQKLEQMIPVTQSVDPVIAPAHAPAAVPLRQYSPPMIAAPAPPVKIAPVIAHQSTMYCVCGKNMLKQNAHTATPITAKRSAQMCCVGVIAFFFSGRMMSWMKMLPHECR